uniref:NADH-ubiquinone oxidoreductase chain 2 n=1 Tax=Sipyloidea sipylus TaxID=202427 RepID=E2RV35_SIPSI|nr:NADH dehydrogenase subunit 2 [Sipyloidea sipylus]
MNKSTNMLFMSMLIMSIPITLSANSWFMVWMGMELNIMSFMPMIMEQKNTLSKEAALTYFLIQTIASMLLIMSIIMMTQEIMNKNMGELLLISSLMIKSGMSPFHFWMPMMMEGLNWNKCLILMTWQKIIPLTMMSSIIKINFIILMAIILSITIGAIGGLNQTSLRKLMAYSSISNNGWMLMAMLMSENIWIMYFLFYSIMSIIMTTSMNMYKNYHMNQILSMNESILKKFFILINMLSISGLPPMLGFMPKWLVIQTSMNLNQMTLMMIMVIMTLITVYYYLRIMFTTMMLTNTELKWNNKLNNMNNYVTMMMTTITIMGLMLITMIMY